MLDEENPIVDGGVGEEPVVDEPVTEPVTDEPINEEPVNEEPINCSRSTGYYRYIVFKCDLYRIHQIFIRKSRK